jgi:hypothetical protein
MILCVLAMYLQNGVLPCSVLLLGVTLLSSVLLLGLCVFGNPS